MKKVIIKRMGVQTALPVKYVADRSCLPEQGVIIVIIVRIVFPACI